MENYKRIMIDGVHYYGKHLILTAKNCSDALLSLENMTQFLQEMVPAIDMVAYGEPIIARFGEGIEVGISAVQLIETSAITVHTNDQARELYLDVFSCKGFNESIVINEIQKRFAPDKINFQILLRN